MSRPRLLDLFCCAGGAGMGYHRAGFDVTGVDIAPQPNYPFAFVQGDALEFLRERGREFDAIHASPPCQGYTWGTRRGREKRWPLRIPTVRSLLVESGRPWVIENVPNARKDMHHPILLDGPMFGLRVLRPRLFESSVFLLMPPRMKRAGSVPAGDYVTVAGHGGDNAAGNYRLSVWRDVMQMPWAKTREELAEAIPPAYTRFIGAQLMRELEVHCVA